MRDQCNQQIGEITTLKLDGQGALCQHQMMVENHVLARKQNMILRVNGSPVETFNFPGGECHIRLQGRRITDRTDVFAVLASSDDVMCLLLTVDAVRRINPETLIHLEIPYVPYARQDRICNPGEPLSIRVMASLINSLQCASVTVHDPHSDVTPALIDRCTIVSQAELINASRLAQFIANRNLTLISPDAGAEKKIHAVARAVSANDFTPKVVCAAKVRDTQTGRITETVLHGDVRDERVIIVDDICDGGQTFIALAETLKMHGAVEIHLYVTHGIFSKGLDVLRPHFTSVYCRHLLLPELQAGFSDFLTVLDSALTGAALG